MTLQNLDAQLKNLENEFSKTAAEIAEIFCLVSGRIPKVREYLTYERKSQQNAQKNGSQVS